MSQLAPLSDADWLKEKYPPADEGFGEGLVGIVPEGFARYIRILHPMERSLPQGMSWEVFLQQIKSTQFQDLPELDSESISWENACTAFGKKFHPLIQSRAIFSTIDPQDADFIADNGWRYDLPADGNIPSELFRHLMNLMTSSAITTSPLTAAIWEGWGGLTSSAGVAYLSWSGKNSLKDRFLNRLRRVWSPHTQNLRLRKTAKIGTGALSVEEATSERLALPHRGYILFHVEAETFTKQDWPDRVSWTVGNFPQTPSLIWPDNHSWVLISEIDFDSTIIACDDQLAKKLLKDPLLETVEVSLDADLSWQGDTLNPYTKE